MGIAWALGLTIVGFIIDVIASLTPWWAVWIPRPGTMANKHDGLFADCGRDPPPYPQCRFYDSGKFLKTPIWLFVCQLCAMLSMVLVFFSIICIILDYTKQTNIKRNTACAWMLLISGLLICTQVIVFGGAGAWFYGIRFTDMGQNINDRIFGWSFYVQLATGPILLSASANVFHNVRLFKESQYGPA